MVCLIREDYFNWLVHIVSRDRHYVDEYGYEKLFKLLHDTEFTYIIPKDANRAGDGINMRWRYVLDKGLEELDEEVEAKLSGPCSVLEMMVALALRCEENIMMNADYGDRTSQWFWTMIVTLGLGSMNDAHFDMERATLILNRFLERDYAPNGTGGLFKIRGCKEDLRKIEIWIQLLWYLNTLD